MADIPVSDLTIHGTEGEGVFDQMMEAVSKLLQDQYDKGRIRGTDYANVYLGAMQWAMQQAVTFLLQKQIQEKSADKIDAEVALLWQKKMTEQAQIDDEVEPVDPREITRYIQADPFDVIGSVGKEKEVRTAQVDGYSRDAETKLLKAMLDNRGIELSAGTENLNTDAQLKNLEDFIGNKLGVDIIDGTSPDITV